MSACLTREVGMLIELTQSRPVPKNISHGTALNTLARCQLRSVTPAQATEIYNRRQRIISPGVV